MAMIASGVMILRKGNSSDWPSSLDTQMNNWTTQYITWMNTSPIAYLEATAPKYVSSKSMRIL